MSDTTLWLDTNVVHAPAKLGAIARLAKAKAVRLVAHPQVHLETTRQMRVKMGEAFAQSYVDFTLAQLGVEIRPFAFDKEKAERWAAVLATWFPTDTAWQEAKRRAVRVTVADGMTVPESARVPMTTDWLLVLEAHEAGDRVSTEEKRKEWKELRERGRALTIDETIAWLEAL